MSYGKVEEPSSSRSRCPSTARSGATSAILTAISSRLVKAQILRTVDTLPGWPVILPRLREDDLCGSAASPRTILESGSKHVSAALLLVKKPLNQLFQSRFALRQAHF